MPTFDFLCPFCNHKFEYVVARVAGQLSQAEVSCPKCATYATRQLSCPARIIMGAS